MRICFFARVKSPEILDRVNFYAQDIKILKELGHEVIIATKFKEIPLNCDFYYIWWWTWAFMPLIKAKFGSKPTLITGTFNYAPPAGLDNMGGVYKNRPFWQRWIIQQALSRANANVFVSRHEFNLVPANLYVSNPCYIPHVVDVDLYTPADVPKEPFIFNVAWSGAISAQRKCLKQIIEAFAYIVAKHPEIRLVMAGEQGEYHPVLIKTAEALKVSHAMDFIGIISEEKKIKLMQRCSVYLQPTLYEGFGLAVAEAMACGAAVVSSPVGAVPEVVGDCGLMVNGQEPQAIAKAVNQILDNPDLRHTLSQRAREHIVKNFAYERRKREIKKIIAELIEK